MLARSSPSLSALVRVLLYVDDAVEIHDSDGICVFVNPAWARLTGQRPDEVIGKPSPPLPTRGVRRVLLNDELGRRSHSVVFRREAPGNGRARPTERDARFDRAVRGANEGLWELELATGQLLLSLCRLLLGLCQR